ncbi:GGDEF domain-containing protein [Acinetobacter kyonggiensis]|uniref:diguanylate cyclase n=1 Tax=Acinetobacter kyonggiensis TaxID=595670 RepID=A0A1H3KUD0_9GAMM|nr:GGDEF domain-containing protein [Acinetobacter kyonggiensis]SDY55264.1 diguanylate cyclase (GGDEF) domain-containing protein [Acinetobacter kyonggiensis]
MKKNLPPNPLTSLKAKIAKYLLEDEVIMNWSVLNKCILILILGSLVHVIWIIWKSFILLSPNLWDFVHLPLLKLQLKLDILFCCLLIIMVFPCTYWHKKKWAQRWLPYLSIGILVLSLCRNGSMIGVLSPATMVSYVSLVTVGLVLFNRKIVYYTLIPVTLFLILSNYLSLQGQISYAPLFNLSTSPYQNKFWVISMLYFIVPILIICLILFEILLSQWRHREQLIQHLSQIDPLTNTLNRRSIKACLEKLEHKPTKAYALVLIDLDHFKQINDQYGHNKGDETLIQVSQALSQIIRDNDVVGRFGGEEFILILNQSSLAQAQSIAERCRQAIQALHLLSNVGDIIKVTASFGIAFSSTETNPQKLLSQADKALYEAKACGRNQVKCYAERLVEAKLY